MALLQTVLKNIESFGLKHENPPYLLDIDYDLNHKLTTYYETKIKECSVCEYHFVGVTEKFGVTYHHYLPDYSKIHPKYKSVIPNEYYMPDRKYITKNLSKYPTSVYFGDYIWSSNTKWNILYKENEKLFLILK